MNSSIEMNSQHVEEYVKVDISDRSDGDVLELYKSSKKKVRQEVDSDVKQDNPPSWYIWLLLACSTRLDSVVTTPLTCGNHASVISKIFVIVY